jgi:chromosomal replication initiator protein
LTRGLFSLSADARDAAGTGLAERAQRGAMDDESFVAGEENALVRVLAAAAMQEPLRYNPIVLCGPTGVGKSLVARALVSRRRAALGLANVIETTGADLARSLAHAVEVRATDELRARHQRCDLLLVDDCQAIATKPAAQQFLLASIDALVRRGSLVVVTLSQSPALTRKLLPALASRLTAGLVVTLAQPGFEARCELVRRVSERMSVPLAAEEIEQLAGGGKRPARFLTAGRVRAAVMKVAAKSSGAANVTVDGEELARTKRGDEKMVSRQAGNVVARHFGLTVGELRGKLRSKSIAEARGLAMYVVRELTGASYGRIGKQFGGRDHTTVLHACNKVADAMEKDPLVGRLVEDLARQVAEA